MHTVGAFEAKNTLGSLLDKVEAGEEVLITRHGRPVARLVPDRDIEETRTWADFLVAAPRATADFMEGVDDPPPQERD